MFSQRFIDNAMNIIKPVSRVITVIVTTKYYTCMTDTSQLIIVKMTRLKINDLFLKMLHHHNSSILIELR